MCVTKRNGENDFCLEGHVAVSHIKVFIVAMEK